MKWLFFIFLFPFFIQNMNVAETHSTDSEDEKICISSDEKELIDAINSYRKRKGLKAVKASSSMSIVARQHVKELNDEIKDLTHSWVDCKYKGSNPKSYKCMWEKPRELAGYPGYGYECAFAKWGAPFSVEEVLESWQSSPGHNNIIINKKIWSDSDWNAIGVAIYGNYAVLWLGEKVDPKGIPVVCN